NIVLYRRLFAVLLLFVVAVRLSVSVLHVHTPQHHSASICDNVSCIALDGCSDQTDNPNSENNSEHTDNCQLCQFIFTPLQIASTYTFEAVELDFVVEYISQNQSKLQSEVILFKQSRAPPAAC
ncbi:MAG: hypothetical protein R3Y59_02370, partial [bacterium]